MNIVFDPTIDNQLATYAFDDSGMPATRILNRWNIMRGLGGIESQVRSNVDGVSNLKLLHGIISQLITWQILIYYLVLRQEMRLYSIERGVYMESNRSIDDYQFQFGWNTKND